MQTETVSRKIQTAVPNFLTAARLVLSVLFLIYLNSFLMHMGGVIELLILFACICLTDYLDGKLARKLDAATPAGAVFDVSVDCFYICSSVFLFICFQVLPWWFLLLIAYKFVEFIVTSHLMNRRTEHSRAFVFDPAGRAASVLFFLLPGACCIVLSIASIPQSTVILCLLLGVTALTLFSSVIKIRSVAQLYA